MRRAPQVTAALLFLALTAASAAEPRRSSGARAAFLKQHPCPATGKSRGACPGWVIDHVKPLACGGADHPANMQWQTVQAAKEKDRWERSGCKAAGSRKLD